MERKSSPSVRVFYPSFNTQQLVEALRQKIEGLRVVLPLKMVALFGSYATGRYTVASDVDLLVVYQGGTRPEAYGLVQKTLDIPRLEPHLFSETEYQGQEATIKRMISRGIVIWQE